MDNWIILYVYDGAEERVVRKLKEKLNPSEFQPFIPMKEVIFRRKGIDNIELKMLFPGYVFMQTNVEADLIFDKIKILVRSYSSIYSVLHYDGNEKNIALNRHERISLEQLMDENFCIKGSIGIITDGILHITSGPLMGMENKVNKIDRHKRSAIVTLEAV